MSSRFIKKKRLRVLLVTVASLVGVVVILGVAGAVGYHVFTGWRARDLAAKAMDNFDQANYRIAWLQITSAKELRAEDPEVLRVLGTIEAAMGRASALDHYEKLSQKTALTPDDMQARADIAVRFGNDEQFKAAVDALEEAGQVAEAGKLRATRKLSRGDIDRAIAEAREAAAHSDDPSLKLALARLLAQRFGPEAGPRRTPSNEAMAGLREAVQILEGLLQTPLRNDTLAFALNELKSTPANRRRWAAAAMEQPAADNPAILAAATVLVRSGQKTPQQIHEQLRPSFDTAPLDRRAAYALWLTGAGLPSEALTLITAQEASESTAAFGARTEALFASDNTDAVLAAVEAGGNVDADVRMAAKARAEYARGRGAQGGATALREAMDAAAKLRRLEFLLPAADGFGASNVVDEKIIELCDDHSLADYAFRVARDRFSRSGQNALLSAALVRALGAAPQSLAVRDYESYTALLESRDVDLETTAELCRAEPSNVAFRITHALNMLKKDRPAEAAGIFDDITVFADRLPPGQLAVVAAVLAASGKIEAARSAAKAIDSELLSPGEYALVLPLRISGSPANTGVE